MPDVDRGNRPLSPHISIYRPQWTSVTSILTRITGNALILASVLIVWWFLAASYGPDYFATADAVLTSWFGDLVLFGSLWAVWYHFLAGLRHLYWGTGNGFELEQAKILAYGVVGGSLVLTILTVLVI